ncbi:tRNA (adenosine(37)-N6)-dimethylallyltransferase MiaA [Buchnera aphidicola]|uniref:tRNA (adenosine(37)-N6)-dimethylallyltransferase MiaA n=1 Tax=Buchnera aphidicola TaxID=9 RepID=UPI0032EF6659
MIFLIGPTASNKTKLAIKLSQFLPIDLISVDSCLIYKELNIGIAKPSLQDLVVAPHRLINIKNIKENYCVESFRKDALFEIEEILSTNRIPLLVGGTMFYFNVLLNGLSLLPPRNDLVREKILKDFSCKKKYSLYDKLIQIDPEISYKIHPNDLQRIIRALEIYFISGNKMSDLIKFNNYEFPYNVIKFIVFPESKDILHKRIELRLKKMLSSGFKEEVEEVFLNNDVGCNVPGMKCLGYIDVYNYILGKITYDDMFFKILHSTKQLAKKQITWLKSYRNCFWINSMKEEISINFMIKNIQRILKM